MAAENTSKALEQLWSSHPRQWRDFDYVYPVISRRSKGLSIGVNLNVDKVCNWDCAYCQVDRTVAPKREDVDLDELTDELRWMTGWAASGEIWADEAFADVPPELRRVNDIAFSGDGEPTTYAQFDEACRRAAEIKAEFGLDDTKLIVLTNMTMVHRPQVQAGLAVLDANNGEIWAKLDAGTQKYYDVVDRAAVKLERIVANITDAAIARPLVIQSLFMKVRGRPTPAAEFDAYLDRLEQIVNAGGQIKLVQLYTIARQTAETYVSPLEDEQLDALAERLHRRLPELPYEVFYGVDVEEG